MKKLLFTLLAAMLIITGCATNNQEEIQPAEPIEGEIVGGWEERVDQEVTDELLGIFNKGVEGTEYEGWFPTKLLATQVVSGVNFKFLCENGKELVVYQNLNKEYFALNEDGSVAEKVAEVGPAAILTKDEVLSIALADAGVSEPRFVEVSLDRERAKLVYDVDFEDGDLEYDYEIDAFSGEILAKSSEQDIEHFSIVNKNKSTSSAAEVLDDAKIKEIVFAEASVNEADVNYLRIERDYDDGIREAEVEFYIGNTEYSFTVNAETGEIIEREIDNN